MESITIDSTNKNRKVIIEETTSPKLLCLRCGRLRGMGWVNLTKAQAKQAGLSLLAASETLADM